MELNLYRLCDEEHNKGSIKAILNQDLKNIVKKSVLKLKKRNVKLKDLSDQVGIDYTTLWKYLNRRKLISLSILKKLEEMSNVGFQSHIIGLNFSQGRFDVKCPNQITEDMARIVGAIIADGHLRLRKAERGLHYELIVRDEFKSNLDALSRWFQSTFNVKILPKGQENHYFIYLSNKIIFKFYNNIFGIPSGKKSDIVSVPKIIACNDLKIKKAFLQGIFMFDGGVDYGTGYVSLISKSRRLVEGIDKILYEIGLTPDYIRLSPDTFGRYRILFRKKGKLVKCLELFEKNTHKWNRLNEHLYGLESMPKDLNMAIKFFDLNYPRKRKNSISFQDVLIIINNLGKIDVKILSKELKRNKTVVYYLLRKLENWDILHSERIYLKKIWKINPKLLSTEVKVYG